MNKPAIEFVRETDVTFSNEELHELRENVEHVTVGMSITTSIPNADFGSITAKFEITGRKPEGFDYDRFCDWLRLEGKRKLRIAYDKQSRGQV